MASLPNGTLFMHFKSCHHLIERETLQSPKMRVEYHSQYFGFRFWVLGDKDYCSDLGTQIWDHFPKSEIKDQSIQRLNNWINSTTCPLTPSPWASSPHQDTLELKCLQKSRRSCRQATIKFSTKDEWSNVALNISEPLEGCSQKFPSCWAVMRNLERCYPLPLSHAEFFDDDGGSIRYKMNNQRCAGFTLDKQRSAGDGCDATCSKQSEKLAEAVTRTIMRTDELLAVQWDR